MRIATITIKKSHKLATDQHFTGTFKYDNYDRPSHARPTPQWKTSDCVTFTSREWVIPVSADSVQTRKRSFSYQRISRLTFKRHSHPNTKVCANDDAIPERPRVWATLELVGWRDRGQMKTNILQQHWLNKNHIIWFGIVYVSVLYTNRKRLILSASYACWRNCETGNDTSGIQNDSPLTSLSLHAVHSPGPVDTAWTSNL